MEKKTRNNNQGFTLVEVLIALSVVSIALAGVFMAVSQYTLMLSGLQERMWANWAAFNQVTEIQLSRTWPEEGITTGTEKDTRYLFSWEREVTKTPYGRIRKFEISMFVVAGEDKDKIVSLTSYLGKDVSW